jgi:hypothetical protein
MIFTAFYTRATIYESEAARLRRSLDRLNLSHNIISIEDRGSWKANAQYTATFIQSMLAVHPGPIIHLNADAVVWKRPSALMSLPPQWFDLAVHYRKGKELLNGTLWLANTPVCKKTIAVYRELVNANPSERDEQRFLAMAIEQVKPKVCPIPAGYCFIHDVMKDDLQPGEEVFIEQLQASRVHSGSALLANREKRLQEI